MPEVDLRGILVAFAEKNWVVYEALESDRDAPSWKDFSGPVDNLQYGVEYRVLPAAENPADFEAAAQELSNMATYGNILPLFKMPDEDVLDACWFTLAPSQFIVNLGGEDKHIIPLDEAEGLIRDYFTTYDREDTRRSVEKKARSAVRRSERRRQRRNQDDAEHLRNWVDSVTGGQDGRE